MIVRKNSISCVLLCGLFLFFGSSITLAQGAGNQFKIDSLEDQIGQASHDTIKCKLLLEQGFLLLPEDSVKAVQKFNRSIELAKENNWEKTFKIFHEIGMTYEHYGYMDACESFLWKAIHECIKVENSFELGRMHHDLGVAFHIENEYDSARFHYNKVIEIAIKNNHPKLLGSGYNDRGNLAFYESDLSEALQYYLLGLKVREAIQDSLGISGSISNIGLVYLRLEDYENALEYHKRSLEIAKIRDNDLQRSIAYANMGTDYINLKDFENAIDCLYKALEIRKKRDSGLELSRSYSSLGGVYLDLLDEGINWNDLSNKELLDSARINYEKALPLARIHEDRYGETTILKGLGDVYKLLGNKDKAVTFYQQSAELAKTLGGFEEIKMVTRNLARLKADKGDFKSAYYWLDEYINAKDSLYNEDKARELTKMDMQYAFDKEKALEQTEHQHELETQQAIAEANKKKQTVVILLVSAGLFIVLVFSFFLYKRFKITQRQKSTIEQQKHEVEHQKTLVEEKNQEIMDSIQYAKRIQSAILPPDKLVKEYLQNSFILYKPKDIVAGDFYWMEHVGDVVLFSAADCTGHGVPGAMVSVVCNNGLNRSVREFNLKEPGEILDKTREIVVQEFEKSEEDVKDGMDIALCSLRMRNENEDNTDSQSAFHSTLQYAGAHNPLWIIRKGEVNEDDLNLKYPGRVKVEKFNDGYTLIEIRADKQPIGKYDNPVPFTTFTINLEKNDSFYIFSDGFSDQFGGDKGKKFKAKNFKELLVSVQSESMKDQKKKIDSAFEEWRGCLEQLDDVCVIGVRI